MLFSQSYRFVDEGSRIPIIQNLKGIQYFFGRGYSWIPYPQNDEMINNEMDLMIVIKRTKYTDNKFHYILPLN